jgi:hypothetical protein
MALFAVGCAQSISYQIPSNVRDSLYVVQTEQTTTVGNGEALIAEIDTIIQFTHHLIFKGEEYLLEEGSEITAFYTVDGQQVESRPGKVLLASGETVLFYGTWHDYDRDGQVYTYTFVDKNEPQGRITDLKDFRLADVSGERVICATRLDSSTAVYDLDLQPVRMNLGQVCR